MTEPSCAKGTPADDFDPMKLPAIEARLEELGRALDNLGQSTPFGIVALGCGHRARSLWLGLRHASVGPSSWPMRRDVGPFVERGFHLDAPTASASRHPLVRSGRP